MKLLICNDDGIDSDGIITLAKVLAKDHEVTVVAPDGERSASGHATTLRSPIKYKKLKIGNIDAYALSGTPADCAKFGLRHLLPNGVDMVVSGINRGRNVGTDVLYSGTVSAAVEGLLCGFKAIAVSHSGKEYDFEYASQFINKNLGYFYNYENKNTVVNINFPDCKAEDIAGVKVTPLGYLNYNDRYNPHDDGSFLLYSLPQSYTENPENCDVVYNAKNYVTITPLKTDLTDYAAMEKLSEKEIIL